MEAPNPLFTDLFQKTLKKNEILEEKIYEVEINNNKYELLISRDCQYINFKINQKENINIFYYINKYNYMQMIEILNINNTLYEDLKKIMELINDAYINKKISIDFDTNNNIIIKIKIPIGFKEYETSILLNKTEIKIN